MKSFFDNLNWSPPAHWQRISTIDMHTGGEPLRIITSGLPPLEGRTVLEKRRYFRERLDHLRTGLMWEPRGHADMYGAIITPSETADLDVFFLHNEGYSTMCGHAVIAITKLVFETGLIAHTGDTRRLTMNVPAGTVRSEAILKDDQVQQTRFLNVPSFVLLRDKHVDIPGIGQINFDVAYGGAFYAIVDATALGLKLVAEQYSRIIELGRRIKAAVQTQYPIEHPFERDLSFLYGTIFTAPSDTPGVHSRNVTVFADGEVDRSATGSGVSARAALQHARGELQIGQEIVIESIVGSTMSVRAAEQTVFGPYKSVVPEVTGTAFVTGRHEFYFDPTDPLRRGFILR